MSAGFEVSLDPYLSARQARHIHGVIAVAKLKRLVDLLQRNQGEVAVDVEFSLGDGGRVQFELTLRAELVAQCQRCLGDIHHTVDSRRQMMVINDESEFTKVPAEFEPVVAEENRLQLIPVIEDELLLSLPIVFKHNACEAAVYQEPSDDDEDERENPFAVLMQLKGKQST